MPINENEVTKEQIYKAMQCNTADELRAYAKSEGYDITQEEAEAYLDELSDVELDQARCVLGCEWLFDHRAWALPRK